MQKATFWQRRIFWNIRVWEVAATIALYILLGTLYAFTIYLTVSQDQTRGIALNYAYKLLLAAPFWWLFFRKWRHLSLWQKAALHLPASALYVGTWLLLFYGTVDALGWGRLQGAGIWWDVYIPLLVYLIQFAIFHAYFYWQETLRQAQREKDLMRLAHTAELNTLKAQIQPHFLFNTLNSINASMPPSEEGSRTLIAMLADVFRFAMNVTDKETVPLEKELRFIRNVLALEQHRFGDRLAVVYDLDETLMDHPVPPMLLQPLVENAVKHGIAGSLAGGTIFITVKRVDQNICFEIRDSGKGINGTLPHTLLVKGIGLQNTRQRLLRLYGRDLHLAPGRHSGFAVSFTLPLQTA